LRELPVSTCEYIHADLRQQQTPGASALHRTAPIDRVFCHQLHSDAISVCTRFCQEFRELLYKHRLHL